MPDQMGDRMWLMNAAKAADWEIVASQNIATMTRGPEIIEIEYGSGGIPRSIHYTNVDGEKIVIPQGFIRMVDVLDWLNTPQKERKDDRGDASPGAEDRGGDRGRGSTTP